MTETAGDLQIALDELHVHCSQQKLNVKFESFSLGLKPRNIVY